MPPNNQPTVHMVEQALECVPEGVEIMLLGNMSTLLSGPTQGLRSSVPEITLHTNEELYREWRLVMVMEDVYRQEDHYVQGLINSIHVPQRLLQ